MPTTTRMKRRERLNRASPDYKHRLGVEEQLAGQKRVLERLATGGSLAGVLDELARTIETPHPGMLCSILLLDDDGIHLRHGAGPNLPKAYNDSIDGTVIGPAVGSCGTAAYRGERVIVADIATDPLWADYRELALSFGLRACWSEPILSRSDEVLGTFAIYYDQPRHPSDDELRLIEEAAHLASIAIEHARLNEALYKSQERYRAIVDDQTEMICRFEPDCTLTFVNEAYCRYFGRSRDKLLGKSFLALVPEDDRQIVLDNLGALNCENPVRMYEHRVVKSDGSIAWQQWSDRAICDSYGNVLEYQSVGRDITERKRAEERLQASKARLRQLLETTNAIPWEANARTWQLTYVGPQAVKLLGYPREQWYDKDFWANHIHPEDREYAIDFCLKSSQGCKDFEFEYRMITADGRTVWLHDIVSVNGAPETLRGFMIDITERKQAEEALEQRLRFERLLFELSATFINLPANDVDARINEALRRLGEFMDVDRCFLTQFSEDNTQFRVTHFWAREGVKADNFMGKVLLNEELPWYTEKMLSQQSVIVSRVDELPDEAVAEKQYGQSVGIKSSAIVPLVVAGDVIGNVGFDALQTPRTWPEDVVQGLKLAGEIFANALARARAEKKLRRAEQEARQNREDLAHLTRVQIMGEMAAGIAHEINQPLAAIESYAEACARRLKAGMGTPEKVQELIGKIRNQTVRAGSILARLRSMVKRQPVDMTTVDINAVVQETVELANMEATLHDCRIELELTPSLPSVIIDPIQIQQVTLNLINNAIEAMEGIGRDRDKIVTVRTETISGGEIEVSVADHGLGITDVESNNIFQPFYSTKRSGLGMGLSICRSIIEAHGGNVWYSRNLNGGTTFRFWLPTDTKESAS